MLFSLSRPHPIPALLDDEPVLATTFHHARPLEVPGRLRRAVLAIGDLFAAVGLALGFPLVILALGTPIVLCLQFLVWIFGKL